jgi:heat shock protein 4
LVQKEANQENDDKLLHMAKHKRNEIENFIYSTRSKLEGELQGFVTPQEQEVLIKLMNKMEEWFYSESEDVLNKAEIDVRSKELNELGTKVYKRFYDWGKLVETLANVEKVLQTCLTNFNEKCEAYKKGTGTLNQQDIDKITSILTTYNNGINEIKSQIHSYPRVADPPTSWENVHKMADEVVKVLNKLT